MHRTAISRTSSAWPLVMLCGALLVSVTACGGGDEPPERMPDDNGGNSINTVPVANNDSFTVAQDSSDNALAVLADNGNSADSDPDGDSFSITSVTTPNAGGSVSINGSANGLIYSPALGYFGSEQFSYTIDDGNGGTNSATVSMSVQQTSIDINTLPIANDDSFVVDQDTNDNALAVLADNGNGADLDADGDSLSIASVTTPDAGGTLTINSNANELLYTPDTGYSGSETFTYIIDDGNGGSDSATVTVLVQPTGGSNNSMPIANNDSFAVEQDSSGNALAVLMDNGSGADLDADGDDLLIDSVSAPDAGGVVSINGTGNGLLYTPATSYSGSETFTYTINDGNGGADSATVTVSVQPTVNSNTAPVANDDSFTVDQDTSDNALVVLADNGNGADADLDGDSLSITSVTIPDAGGAASINGTNDGLLYTPAIDYSGSETFSYTIDDGNGGSASALVTVVVRDTDPAVSGLDTRPDNLTCLAPPRPTGATGVTVIDPFPNLPNIGAPTKMLLEPVADPRWFVLRKSGQLVTFDPDNATSVSTHIDLSAVVRTRSEGGLLGIAFHPDYPNTPEIFLTYTREHTNPDMQFVVSRFILDNIESPGAGTVEQILMLVDKTSDAHNGGDIDFGDDGYLYISLGDGGGAGDPNNRSQDTTRLLGSMLRIDVLGPDVSFPTNPYAIPPDNPFAGNTVCGIAANANDCPEIYAWGLRSPWRWSFDEETGELWLGDVGQGTWEEIDQIELGGNYGWPCREGAQVFDADRCVPGLTDPVVDYPRSFGASVTGGKVYRGSAIPEIVGRYVFGDFGSGRIAALTPDGQGGYSIDELIDTNFGPTAFAADAEGELYFTDINNGRLRKILPSGGASSDTVPTLLSDTGCTNPVDITQPYAGLVPYDVNALFWSDGAVKERFIGLPNGTTISRESDGDFTFPNGTVLVKNFRLNGELIETRHVMRHPDGVWAGYTYEWNENGTDATRVRGGKTVNIDGQDWIYPSEGQCMECHTSAAGFALGPETSQLNGDFVYSSTGRTANQLETLDHLMMFSGPLPGPAATLPALADPADTNATLSDRARAYLHTNCAQCHRPGGPTPVDLDFRSTTPLSSTNACDALPLEGDLGIANARVIAPGDTARSILLERITRRDSHGMPPVGSSIVDVDGASLLTDWINGLQNCN